MRLLLWALAALVATLAAIPSHDVLPPDQDNDDADPNQITPDEKAAEDEKAENDAMAMKHSH
ncbi:hypothetical protein H257_11055 [Aphanomyces astaci]|uniref:RxLR effector protein n=1 Tax=Aphanomyces astaci TaxID=112090 RepID=W4G4A2_APHAT|nr:hypothetical protein H257_11055 [Aphanomyces astaci]ETV74537.1 hypothetical protein H257_11055 [Aphanomyces astaci]|eukprot:XP_009836195.1 hypothetical protein H257_11055 [Aphanomyces astaci]